MSEAAEEIVELGHRRIGAIFGPRNTSTARAAGDARCATPWRITASRSASRYSHRGPFDFDTGYAGAELLLDQAQRPTVIVCGNDVVALGALNAATRTGLAVPEEVSIVGFDDLPVASWPIVRLTTVAFDLDAMARAAAGLLVGGSKRRSRSPYETLIFTSQLVRRDTLAAAP